VANVLVVENDAPVRGVLLQILEGEGYQVLEAPDSRVAMELFRHNLPDVVVTDIIMPEKDGITFISELRRDFPKVKIVTTAGGRSAGINYLEDARAVGAFKCLAKPLGRKEVLDAAMEALA